MMKNEGYVLIHTFTWQVRTALTLAFVVPAFCQTLEIWPCYQWQISDRPGSQVWRD